MAPPQSHLGHIGKVGSDAHGCPACPHPCQGPIILGSPNVFVNKMPASRVSDVGVHAACCGPNMWTAASGSSTVKINSLDAHRKDDDQTHCGGSGNMTQGSSDVFSGG